MLIHNIAFVAILVASPFAFVNANDNGHGWIEGRWCQHSGEELIEEIWLPELNGELLGLVRTSTSKQMTSFEYLRIVLVNGVVTFIAQPGGRPATSSPRSNSGDKWIRFENPEHDFPQAVEYRREGDTLRAEVSGPGPDGTELVIAFEYTLCYSDSYGFGAAGGKSDRSKE